MTKVILNDEGPRRRSGIRRIVVASAMVASVLALVATVAVAAAQGGGGRKARGSSAQATASPPAPPAPPTTPIQHPPGTPQGPPGRSSIEVSVIDSAAGEPYTFSPTLSQTGMEPSGSLHDTGTGKTIDVPSARSCAAPVGPPVLSGPWLMFDCTTTASSQHDSNVVANIYRLPNGPWRVVTAAPAIQQWCASNTYPGDCAAVAVTNSAVEFEEHCYRCSGIDIWQDISSGSLTYATTAAGGT